MESVSTVRASCNSRWNLSQQVERDVTLDEISQQVERAVTLDEISQQVERDVTLDEICLNR